MHMAVRNHDGTLISDGVWDAIKVSSRSITESLLAIDMKGRGTGRSMTKQFFKSYFNAEWTEAITQLEQMQPLLRFCAAHWKADHVLGNTLTSFSNSSTRPSSKRHAQDVPPAVSKKPRQDEVTADVLRKMHARVNSTCTLSTAAFSRKPPQSRPAGTEKQDRAGGSVSVLSTLKPQAVDPSHCNLIGKLDK